MVQINERIFLIEIGTEFYVDFWHPDKSYFQINKLNQRLQMVNATFRLLFLFKNSK